MDDSTKTQPVESRAAKMLRDVGRALRASTPVPVWTWSLTKGLLRDDGVAETGTLDPREALDFIAAHKDAAIFHLKDFHEPLRESPEVSLRRVDRSALEMLELAAAGPRRAISPHLPTNRNSICHPSGKNQSRT